MERTAIIKTFDGYDLEADVVEPEGHRPTKMAIMCHGINSHRQEYLDMFPHIAAMLAESGIASVRFDFRGHGKSSGSSLDFSVSSQIVDLKSVKRWVETKFPSVGELVFVGVSFGAAPGIFLNYEENCFSKLVLYAPVVSYYRTFVCPTTEWGVKNFSDSAYKESELCGYLLLDGEFKMSLGLLEELRLLDPISCSKPFGRNILLIHGTEDTLVPLQGALEMSERNEDIHLRIIKGMDHGLYKHGDSAGVSEESAAIQRRVYDEIGDFING